MLNATATIGRPNKNTSNEKKEVDRFVIILSLSSSSEHLNNGRSDFGSRAVCATQEVSKCLREQKSACWKCKYRKL